VAEPCGDAGRGDGSRLPAGEAGSEDSDEDKEVRLELLTIFFQWDA
jgi:hypothetical protein